MLEITSFADATRVVYQGPQGIENLQGCKDRASAVVQDLVGASPENLPTTSTTTATPLPASQGEAPPFPLHPIPVHRVDSVGLAPAGVSPGVSLTSPGGSAPQAPVKVDLNQIWIEFKLLNLTQTLEICRKSNNGPKITNKYVLESLWKALSNHAMFLYMFCTSFRLNFKIGQMTCLD